MIFIIMINEIVADFWDNGDEGNGEVEQWEGQCSISQWYQSNNDLLELKHQ